MIGTAGILIFYSLALCYGLHEYLMSPVLPVRPPHDPELAPLIPEAPIVVTTIGQDVTAHVWLHPCLSAC